MLSYEFALSEKIIIRNHGFKKERVALEIEWNRYWGGVFADESLKLI